MNKPPKVFFMKVIRSNQVEPDQAYVVGDFIVAGVRAARWWELLIDRVMNLWHGITKEQNSPDTLPDTNATIGIKITTDHYAELLGMVRPPQEAGLATIQMVPSPKFDQVVTAPLQDEPWNKTIS